MQTSKSANNCDALKHLRHVGLQQNPFPVTPDNLNFFVSDYIDRVTANIVHGILARKGFMVLTGDIGLGKTTISRRIINILERKGVETSLVLHTSFQDVELLREINGDFGLNSNSLLFSDQMRLLNAYLLEQNRSGHNCAIIIDDAQNLNDKSLELVRMISNLEADQHKLVQIVLIGQPELMDHLNRKHLRQLKSRIIIWEVAKPLNLEELEYYLLFKLNASGGNGSFKINRGALKKIYKITRGNFRKVNILMDRCLYAAFLQNTRQICNQVVGAAYADLYPRKLKLRLPRWARVAVLSGFLSFFLIGGLLNAAATHRSQSMLTVVRKKIRASMPSIIGTPSKSKSKRPTHRSPAVSWAGLADPVGEFLAAYGLSKYKTAFAEALKSGQYQRVTRAISKHTGYELIWLETPPDYIRERYGILSCPIPPDGKVIHFLLWRPRLRLKKFHPSYKGREILRLQEKLAALQLYTYRVDGIVGRRLVGAVSRFQKEMALPVTGYPDRRTIFLLCHQNGARRG